MHRRRKDRISRLPGSVQEHILHFLPLKDAGRSSILSSKWRNLWMNLPTLKFDYDFVSKDQPSVHKRMLDICTVLFLHREPLKEISFSLSILAHFPDKLDRILLFLQNKRSIETLTIKKEEGCYFHGKYKLSRRLFSSSFSQLKTLRLSSCEVESSTDLFQGFVKLSVLELESVVFRDSGGLSFRCPLLSSLSLDSCNCSIDGYRFIRFDIEIEAPKLSCFHLVGTSYSLHFKHTPVLKKATINTAAFPGFSSSGLLKVWGGLTSVESLSVSGEFCQDLEGNTEQADDVSPLEMLRHMTFTNVHLSRQSHVNSILLVITSSPNLQRLEITMQKKSITLMSNRIFHGPSELELSRLKRVEMKKLKGTENELAFIKWLLSSSPALDIMKIHLSPKLSDAEKILILTELNRFARASTRALIETESLNHT